MTTTAFTRTTHRPDGTILIVAPRPLSVFSKLARRLGQQFDTMARIISQSFLPAVVKAAADMERSLTQMDALVNGPLADRARRANDPVRVAGLEARYYVRAAMDPSYATPQALHQLVARLVAGEEPGMARLVPEVRRAVAVSAMRGWADRVPVGEPLVVHRLWGTTAVVVRCG